MGERWLAYLDQFEGTIAGVGAALLEFAAFRPGERVLDVGCGAGPTTRDIARAVGPEGLALGLDVSPALIKAAEVRAAEAGLAQLKFRLGDAARADPPEAPFDALFSRFGVMFFDDPAAAFRHMRGWLRPGGRLTFACWAHPRENPWMLEIYAALKRHVELPERDPEAPGPFAFADPDRVRALLSNAGFTNLELEKWTGVQPIAGPGADAKAATEFAVEGQSLGMLLAEQPAEIAARVRAEIEAAFEAAETPDGVMMASAAWFVRAKAS